MRANQAITDAAMERIGVAAMTKRAAAAVTNAVIRKKEGRVAVMVVSRG